MEKKMIYFLAALSLPISFILIGTGALALIMLLLKVDSKLMASVVLWFYFIGNAIIFSISKPALELLNLWRPIALFLTSICGLAIASTIALLL